MSESNSATIVAVYLEKGGSTKSTTTVHVAHGAARRGLRVLVLDIDGQRHSSIWLHGEPKERILTINEVARNPDLAEEAIVATRVPGVDLMYGSSILPALAESALKVNEADGVQRNPFTVLRTIARRVAHRFDLILIDCSPTVGQLNTNALVAADHVLVPMDQAKMTYRGLTDVATTLVKMRKNDIIDRIPPLTVLLTKTESDEAKGTREIRSMIQAEDRPYTVLSHTIRYRKQMEFIWPDATAFELADGGNFRWIHLRPVAQDYANATDEFTRLLGLKRKSGSTNAGRGELAS